MSQARFSVYAALIAGPLCVTAGAAEMVRDINTVSITASNSSSAPLDIGSVAVFALDDGIHGLELWASDGTAAGTTLVRDINPGAASSGVESLTAIGNVAYFWADDGTNGRELWRSDGTKAGTFIVANIGPGAADFGGWYVISRPIHTMNDILYFQADDGQTGGELWRSDGTRAGTYRLSDIRPGSAGSAPERFVLAGPRLFFTADDGVHGRELWSTDGTPAGTSLVFDVAPGASDGSDSYDVAVVGDSLFFMGTNPAYGSEPWRVSVTGTGAAMVADINTVRNPPVPARTLGSEPAYFTPVGDGVVFTALTPVYNATRTDYVLVCRLYYVDAAGSSITVLVDSMPSVAIYPFLTVGRQLLFRMAIDSYSELWVTDGTSAGTHPLRPGGQSLTPAATTSATVVDGDTAYFYASTGGPGSPQSIWRTDGTAAGTREYAALPQPAIAAELVKLNSRLYFPAGHFSDSAGGELWTTDGTSAGTQRVADIHPGPGSSSVRDLAVARGRLFFRADDGVTGLELWVSDGSAAGTISLGDLNRSLRTASSKPYALTPAAGGLLFVADDGVSGAEVWTTDGTSAGTHEVFDIAPGASTSMPGPFLRLGDFVLFQANDGSSGRELWRSDGTGSGTVRVADIAPGSAHGSPFTYGDGAVLDGVAYFAANDGTHGTELWRSDGTAAGTRMLAELTAGPDSSIILMMGTLADKVIFRMQNGERGRLWATDGTAQGTVELRSDLEVTASLGDRAVVGDYLYFAGNDDATEKSGLWRTDGTSGGTQPVTTQDLMVYQLRASGTTFIFSGCDSSSCALYGSDGTDAGTRKILDRSLASDTVGDGSRLFFIFSVAGKPKVFVSDGTPNGTKEFLPAQVDLGGDPVSLGWLDGRLFITVRDAERGPVIWRSDGTAAGTLLFADIDPGTVVDDSPRQYTTVGSRMFFTAGHVDSGTELYVIETGRPYANADRVQVPFEAATRMNVLANDVPFTGNLVRDSVQVVLAPRFGSVSVDAASGEIVYTPTTGFSGQDSLEYRVRDDESRWTNVVPVAITVTAKSGQGPGSAPPPPATGGDGGGSSGGGSGGGSSGGGSSGGGSNGGTGSSGGGGAFDWLALTIFFLIATATNRCRLFRLALDALTSSDATSCMVHPADCVSRAASPRGSPALSRASRR
ncbi:MAG TPA: Ig-like domain-containing protein [Povalibacter sp.]|nr:Ig-like domain-containing protein [Povalibacter sp.]